MKPMIKYRGGKTKELSALKRHFPRKFDRYIEPFLGGGAVFFDLEPNVAIINDVNDKLMAFYFDVRNNFDRLKEELRELQNTYEHNQQDYAALKKEHPDERVPNRNEDLYYELREEYNHPTGRYLAGTLYYFINKTAYSGMIQFNAKGEYNVPFGRYANFNTELVTEGHKELLQRTQIFNGDYEAVFAMAKPNDFIFLDPPYDCVFNDYGNIDHIGGFTEKDQIRLARAFRNLPCKALMVVAETPIIDQLYGDLIVDRYSKDYAVNIRNRFKNSATHVIIKNYREEL